MNLRGKFNAACGDSSPKLKTSGFSHRKGYKNDRNWSTYLLKCSDGSLYCGVTKNMKNRLIKHNEGTASKYTRSRLPIKLAAVKGHLTKREAYQLEYQIKKTPTHKKITTLNDWKAQN